MQTALETYIETIEEFRRRRVESLLGDFGFFTLAGLFWLAEGENTFGRGRENDIVLPSGVSPDEIPRVVGVFHLQNGVVTVEIVPGVQVLDHDDQPVTAQVMQTDATDAPDYLFLGNLALLILQRGERLAVRLYDKEHSARKNFAGLRWYPVDPSCRLTAEFIPCDPPKMLTIVDAVGTVTEQPSPGAAQFDWQGATYRLDALDRGDRLFYIFADAGNGQTTYGAGRFLYSAKPENGTVELDFNRATNPFCAYTPYGTCPLPPDQNRLPFVVEAGEMDYIAPAATA